MGLEELHRGRGHRQEARARPDRPGHRQGGQGLDPREHPSGVDVLRLRGAERRGDGRPDLPDELPRGVPVRAGELRRGRRDRRGRGAAREGARRARLPAEAEAHPDDGGDRRRRDLDERARAARRGPRRGPVGAALERGDPRRHLHDHLHVGHDRPAQGLRHLARQLPLDADDVGHRERAGGGRDRLPLPPPRPQLRAADPAPELRPRRQHRLLGARPAEDRPQPLRGQARGLPLGSPHLREDLHRRDRRRHRGEEGDHELGDRGRQEGAREGAGRQGPRLPARAPVQAGRQARARARSARSSAATSGSASPARRRSTPRSCASSTGPAS